MCTLHNNVECSLEMFITPFHIPSTLLLSLSHTYFTRCKPWIHPHLNLHFRELLRKITQPCWMTSLRHKSQADPQYVPRWVSWFSGIPRRHFRPSFHSNCTYTMPPLTHSSLSLNKTIFSLSNPPNGLATCVGKCSFSLI